jgi:hypothetical protein
MIVLLYDSRVLNRHIEAGEANHSGAGFNVAMLERQREQLA